MATTTINSQEVITIRIWVVIEALDNHTIDMNLIRDLMVELVETSTIAAQLETKGELIINTRTKEEDNNLMVPLQLEEVETTIITRSIIRRLEVSNITIAARMIKYGMSISQRRSSI